MSSSSTSICGLEPSSLLGEYVAILGRKDWSERDPVEGVSIATLQLEGSSVQVTRGVYDIAHPPDDVVRVIRDMKHRPEWDDMFLGGEIVQGAQEDDIAVVRLMFDSGSMFVSNRDMCFLRYVKHEDNGTIYILAKSVVHDQCPEDKKFVRAKIYISGYVLEPIVVDGRPGTRGTYIMQIDYMGMVPAFITNAVSRKQPLTLKRVGDFLDRDGLELISSSG